MNRILSAGLATLLVLSSIPVRGEELKLSNSQEKADAPPTKTQWSKRASFGPGRILHSAVWTYGEMIVWGGGSEHQFYNSGGIYDPVTNQWRPTSLEGAPSGRWGHAAVWTGTEMIIWGGRSSFTPTSHQQDGFLYDPRLNRWRPMSMNGAPSGRSQMAAVWTGEELIVWGGWSDEGKCPNSGGAYNPRTDTWRNLPIPDGLPGRMEPSAVWTGREMIVWGGLLEGERTTAATGARFDPEKQQWTLLSTKDAPPGLRGHQAVWTGEEMVLWGGANLDGETPVNRGSNAGFRYSPSRDAWTRLPISDAVQGRLYHSVVWSGSELLITGGGDQEKGLAESDAVFSPSLAEWSGVSRTSGPSPRSMSTALWTGDGVLVYGGSTGGSSAFDETHFLRLGK